MCELDNSDILITSIWLSCTSRGDIDSTQLLQIVLELAKDGMVLQNSNINRISLFSTHLPDLELLTKLEVKPSVIKEIGWSIQWETDFNTSTSIARLITGMH